MYKNINDVKNAMKNGEVSGKQYQALTQYFNAVEEAAEDIYVIDDWSYDEDEECNLIVIHDPVAVSKKDLFRNYSLKNLTNSFCDVINCVGHCLTKEEIQEIFWDMGN